MTSRAAIPHSKVVNVGGMTTEGATDLVDGKERNVCVFNSDTEVQGGFGLVR